MIKKLTPLEWEHYIKKTLYEDNVKRKKVTKKVFDYARYLPVPLLIGLIAAYIMYYFYGTEILIQTLLSWTIGITLVTTIVASIIKLMER